MADLSKQPFREMLFPAPANCSRHRPAFRMQVRPRARAFSSFSSPSSRGFQRDVSSLCALFHVLPSPYYLLAPASSARFCADLKGLQPSSGCGEERREGKSLLHGLTSSRSRRMYLCPTPDTGSSLQTPKHQIFLPGQKDLFLAAPWALFLQTRVLLRCFSYCVSFSR